MTDTPAEFKPLEGSHRIPSFEHAEVRDALRLGVITCLPDTSMEAVARIMVTNHVHAVIVAGLGGVRPWGVVTDRDVLAAATEAPDTLAGSCATSEFVTVAPGERLDAAAQLMQQHDVSHLMVVDRAGDVPIGVLSTLDIAGILAWGRA